MFLLMCFQMNSIYSWGELVCKGRRGGDLATYIQLKGDIYIGRKRNKEKSKVSCAWPSMQQREERAEQSRACSGKQGVKVDIL